jgi:hypothetical protein
MKPIQLPCLAAILALGLSLAQAAEDVVIRPGKSGVEVLLPITSVTGKVRVKQRMPDGFGVPIAPRQIPLGKSCYIEWQIGYDTPDPHDISRAPGIVFQRRGETKYGHELSTILLDAHKAGLLTTAQLRATKKFLAAHRNTSFEGTERIVTEEAPAKNSALPSDFTRRVEKAPLYTKQTPHGAIELELKHKQRAVGYQAMLYVCLPMSAVLRPDGSPRPHSPARAKEVVIYRFDRGRMEFLLDIVRAFGLASPQHNADLTKIIDLVLAQ